MDWVVFSLGTCLDSPGFSAHYLFIFFTSGWDWEACDAEPWQEAGVVFQDRTRTKNVIWGLAGTQYGPVRTRGSSNYWTNLRNLQIISSSCKRQKQQGLWRKKNGTYFLYVIINQSTRFPRYVRSRRFTWRCSVIYPENIKAGQEETTQFIFGAKDDDHRDISISIGCPVMKEFDLIGSSPIPINYKTLKLYNGCPVIFHLNAGCLIWRACTVCTIDRYVSVVSHYNRIVDTL